MNYHFYFKKIGVKRQVMYMLPLLPIALITW